MSFLFALYIAMGLPPKLFVNNGHEAVECLLFSPVEQDDFNMSPAAT